MFSKTTNEKNMEAKICQTLPPKKNFVTDPLYSSETRENISPIFPLIFPQFSPFSLDLSSTEPGGKESATPWV
jgi:hypothetical protein